MSVSIVIPAFNAEATIAAAIRSALDQTCPADEIIVVDDGSSDRTSEVVRAEKAEIRLLQQENAGAGAARRTGTMAASGDLVAYLDADDWWTPEWLETAVSIMSETRCAMLVGDLARADPGAKRSDWGNTNRDFFPSAVEFLSRHGQDHTLADDLHLLKSDAAVDFLLTRYPAFPSCMVVDRRAALASGNWDPRFPRAQDFDFALRMSAHHEVAWLMRTVAVLGLHDGNNDAHRYTIKQTGGVIHVLETRIEECAGSDGDPELCAAETRLARCLARQYCALGYALRKGGDLRGASDAYRHALEFPGRKIHALVRLAWLHVLGLGRRL